MNMETRSARVNWYLEQAKANLFGSAKRGDHVDKFHVYSNYSGGVTIEVKDEVDENNFTTFLKTSISQCRQQRLKYLWLYLPVKFMHLRKLAVMEGFYSYKPSSGNHRLLYKIHQTYFNLYELLAAADKWKREDDSSPPNDIENPKPPNDIEDSNLPKRILNPPEVPEDPNPTEYSNLSKRTLIPQVVSGDPNRSEDPNRLKDPNPNKDLSTRKNRFQLYILLMGVIGVMLQTFHQAVEPTLQNTIRLGASFGFLIGNIILANRVLFHTGDRPINKWISFIFNFTGTMPLYLGYSMFIPEWYGWIGFPVLCIILAIIECREKLRKVCKWSFEKCVSGVKFLGRCFRSSSSNARLRRFFSC